MSLLNLPTLLVITESPPIRHWIQKHLDQQFFIIAANTQKKALETVRTCQLDFIILDASFEDADPLELCKTIRAAEPLALYPILLITGRLKKSYRDHALDAGVTDFLSEQLDVEELETRIAIGRKAMEVRQKVAELSFIIPAPNITAPNSYFKNKALHDQTMDFLQQAKAQNKRVMLLLTQIDQFEDLQAKYGFAKTDELLRSFAKLLNQTPKKEMSITPTIDGQFALLFSDSSNEESQKIAKFIQKKIKENIFQISGGPIQITTSWALSNVEPDEISFHKKVTAANQALKSKKNSIVSIDKEIS